ncbi:MAG: pilus assembly protein CpaB [Alphaproteobacteria bacterium]|jgi:pilus assembly protein CpaB|nr:pilus assembly protein CpaB [Alphaproteobacteria bacterium]
MKIARIAVLGVALAAGGAAAYLVSGSKPAPTPQVVQAPPPVQTEDVLVAAKELNFGALLGDGDMSWQAWPNTGAGKGVFIRKSDNPTALADVKGSLVRGTFLAGEPLRRDRLVKGPTAGLMSTMLSPGRRAVAINIDSQGATSAGGFVLPNDRVDVVRTYRDDEATKASGSDVVVTQTILSNVRVLAIGQNVQNKGSEGAVVVGSNATLELDPKQAELIILAQRTGQLSLTLRAMVDANKDNLAADSSDDAALTIVRFGVSTQARVR